MDIRIDVKFKFEKSEYHADILIIKLSSSPLHFLYVAHIFDDWLSSEFAWRYIFKTTEHKFLWTNAKTEREALMIESLQNAILNNRYHPPVPLKNRHPIRET
jgi:hypothetical protein